MQRLCRYDTGVRHRGLRLLCEEGHDSGIRPSHRRKLRMMLATLDSTQVVPDISILGWRSHRLSGDRLDRWSVSVNKNWRHANEFDKGDLFALDYEDYH
ncbi:MAG: type II toxin-antitoxin system RelE/ParE family toxin [Pontimonas sp.]